MAKLKVKLRVVGVYFNQYITFDDGGGTATIEMLHNAAMSKCPISRPGEIFFTGSFEQPSGLDLNKPNPIRTVSHNYPGKFDFNGNGSLKDAVDGNTLGGRSRAPGIYELSEQLIENGLLAWQYYVKRGDVLASETPSSRGFQSYQTFPLKNEDEVTWRLVSIATKPIAGSYRELRLKN